MDMEFNTTISPKVIIIGLSLIFVVGMLFGS